MMKGVIRICTAPGGFFKWSRFAAAGVTSARPPRRKRRARSRILIGYPRECAVVKCSRKRRPPRSSSSVASDRRRVWSRGAGAELGIVLRADAGDDRGEVVLRDAAVPRIRQRHARRDGGTDFDLDRGLVAKRYAGERVRVLEHDRLLLPVAGESDPPAPLVRAPAARDEPGRELRSVVHVPPSDERLLGQALVRVPPDAVDRAHRRAALVSRYRSERAQKVRQGQVHVLVVGGLAGDVSLV